jgi:hypothetical protein
MSDNFNPKDLGTTGFFSESGTLDSSNTQDTFRFNLPNFEELVLDRQLNKVDLLYSFGVDFFNNLSQPINLSIGIDSNSDGSFDQTDEILGSTITVEPDPTSSNVLITMDDIIANLSVPEDLLNQDQTLFLDIESTDPSNSNSYDLDFELTPIYAGELSTSDSLYCCDDHNKKYYYDRLDEISFKAGENDVEVGDELDFNLGSTSFDPVLFLLNKDTGEVIDVAYESTTETIGGVDYQTVNLSLDVQENINYVVSVESALPNQTGEYYLSVL